MLQIEKYKIQNHYSIRQAVKKMDKGRLGFCVCVNEDDEVIGVITDGDFRRAVHGGILLDENINKIINRDYYYVQKGFSESEVKKIFDTTIVQQIPVLEGGKLHSIVTALDIRGIDENISLQSLYNPVVIMAGGKGTRLDPFTRILPKPLIPLGNDPVIKLIMDQFLKFGLNDFYISLHDKARMIKAYFHDHDMDYHINYIEEDKPLGTAGALKILEGQFKQPFFVSNCDIIIYADYCALHEFHHNNAFDLTLVGSMQQYTIPYGICDIHNGGTLKQIREKPEYDFLVNTGLYLLEPAVLEFIPVDTYFDMTDLISTLQANERQVGVFPVSEKSWVDVGQWSKYKEFFEDTPFAKSKEEA